VGIFMPNDPFYRVKILFFASLKERTGTASLELNLPAGMTVKDVKGAILEKYSASDSLLDNVIVSVNQAFASDDTNIDCDSELAFFPPVSGGSQAFPLIVKITSEDIDLNDLIEQVTTNTTGAACVFTGIVRGKSERTDFKETIALEYEAYIPMAEAKMMQIASEIRQKWQNIEGIAIVQRTGVQQVGDHSVHIVCTSSHRDEGIFEAARYAIDRLKEIVPVWKKEIGPDGEVWVEGQYHPKKGD
jgi:MoaE-MoaD fusion protein